jgi:hypothetical protein
MQTPCISWARTSVAKYSQDWPLQLPIQIKIKIQKRRSIYIACSCLLPSSGHTSPTQTSPSRHWPTLHLLYGACLSHTRLAPRVSRARPHAAGVWHAECLNYHVSFVISSRAKAGNYYFRFVRPSVRPSVRPAPVRVQPCFRNSHIWTITCKSSDRTRRNASL